MNYGDKRKNFYNNVRLFGATHDTIKTSELIDLCKDAGYTAKQSHNDLINILMIYKGIRKVKRGVYAINLKRIVELHKEERDGGKWESDSSPERVIEKMKEFVGMKFINKTELRKLFLVELTDSHSLQYQRNIVEPYIKSGYISVNEKGVYEITKLCLSYNKNDNVPSSSPIARKTLKEKIISAFTLTNVVPPQWVVRIRVWKEGIIASAQFIRRTILNYTQSVSPS